MYFLHCCFTKCKNTQQNCEFKHLIQVQAPISSRTCALLVSVKISFSPDDKQKTSSAKLEQSSALPKTSQDINQQTTLEERKDKARILPQSPEHYIPVHTLGDLEIFWIKGVSVYVKRPAMNLPNHFGAYVNFSNNILQQRFHSLDMLHDQTTLFLLSLLLSCNLYNFLYHKTSAD